MGGKNKNRVQSGRKTKILLLVLVGMLVMIVAALAFYFVNTKMKEKNYTEAVTNAEKYASQNRYEDAIIEYKKAISLNPKDEEAYIGLADIYILQEDVSKAKAILNKGYTATKSVKIQRMLGEVETTVWVGNYLTEDKQNREDFDLDEASENVKLDSSFYQKIVSYTFEDFKDEFGSMGGVAKDSEGYFEVTHARFDGVCYYRNTDENREIVDESRKTPKDSGMPEKISLNSLGLLFRNFEGGVNLDKLQILLSQRVQPQTKDGKTYVEAQLEECIIRIETDISGNIVAGDAWNEIILVNANKQKAKAGQMSGVVLNAVTGDGVPGATVAFTPTGSSGKSDAVRTNQSGVFSAELEPGNYKIIVSADHYIEEEFSCQIEDGKTYSGVQFVISPDLESGTARIVLEWNAEPQDLDSYLFGETDSGDDVLVKFSHKEAVANGKTIASLDLDDIDGYGPETTTIYDLNGVYTFTVADFNRTGTMKQYGATVKVYLPGKQPETITIASDADVKDIWNVCMIDHGELIIINDAPEEDRFTPANK